MCVAQLRLTAHFGPITSRRESSEGRPLQSALVQECSGRPVLNSCGTDCCNNPTMTAPIRALLCSTALTLLCLGSASKDDHLVEQREVTFDISHIMQEMQQPDSHFLQREMDLSDLIADFSQQPSPGFSPRASRPRSFGPEASVKRYSVQFPLARPSSDNIQAICLHRDRRPRYPESYFPASGYGVYKRQADAVNTLEAWFGTCCRDNQTAEETLCCAIQAWEKSVSHFCHVDFSIKAPHFHCCKISGNERLSCFDNSAKNPNYSPTEEQLVQPVPPKAMFNFDPQSCPGTAVIPHSIRENSGKKEKKSPTTFLKVDLTFPLAAPTDSNIESLCRNQKLRPLYNIKCLAGLGYDLVARQAKSTNRLEKGFKQCCKNKRNALPCAQKTWEEEMKKFCIGSKGKKIDFQCCDGGVQFDCFRNISVDPEYIKTVLTESLSLDNLCDTHKVIMKKFPLGFPLKNIVNKCCHQTATERTTCIGQALKEEFEAVCSSRKVVPASVRRCCRASSEQCLDKILMDAITKATGFSHQKKKRCPVS